MSMLQAVSVSAFAVACLVGITTVILMSRDDRWGR